MTKNSAAFNDLMEEARREDDLSYDEFLSQQYFANRLKGRLPEINTDPGDEQPEKE